MGLPSAARAAILGAALLSFFGSPAGAQCAPSTFIPIEIPGVATFYYDDRSDMPPIPGVLVGPGPTRVYEETNGQPGLQRGATSWIWDLAGLGDTEPEFCIQSVTPDRLWL